MTSLPGWGSPPGVEKHDPVMACGCFISTVSNSRLWPSPAAKGEARRGKRHMPMKGSGGTGPHSLMRPPPCRASEATAAQGPPAGRGKRPGAGYDEPPRMGLPAGCGKTWPCHGMWLFHLHSTVKVWPFSPVSHWRDSRLRHFVGYAFGTSRKKTSTTFWVVSSIRYNILKLFNYFFKPQNNHFNNFK